MIALRHPRYRHRATVLLPSICPLWTAVDRFHSGEHAPGPLVVTGYRAHVSPLFDPTAQYAVVVNPVKHGHSPIVPGQDLAQVPVRDPRPGPWAGSGVKHTIRCGQYPLRVAALLECGQRVPEPVDRIIGERWPCLNSCPQFSICHGALPFNHPLWTASTVARTATGSHRWAPVAMLSLPRPSSPGEWARRGQAGTFPAYGHDSTTP
jgi:hypothetical protein